MRPDPPFTVWDGRVRLSIAGYQDKLAVYEDSAGGWFLAEGATIASTHLIKPEPVRAALAGMTTNERLCMALATSIGLPCASTRLLLVPEPVLVIERFDRRRTATGVARLHCIDGCQALGLPVAMKYERPYGHSKDVRNIRDGANLRALFALINTYSPTPVVDRVRLLQWVVYQILIGNTDAHAKNLSFLASRAGLHVAPAYDQVCVLEYEQNPVDDEFAMAIGDEFKPRSITAFDWAQFAYECELPLRLVARELAGLSARVLAQLAPVAQQVRNEGGRPETIDRVREIVGSQAQHMVNLAAKVPKVSKKLL
jgi:serine/threonine-protein kinase HipA